MCSMIGATTGGNHEANTARVTSCYRPRIHPYQGHLRSAAGGQLLYATVLRTGHLVPTVVPKVFAALLNTFLA